MCARSRTSERKRTVPRDESCKRSLQEMALRVHDDSVSCCAREKRRCSGSLTCTSHEDADVVEVLSLVERDDKALWCFGDLSRLLDYSTWYNCGEPVEEAECEF